MAGAWEVIPNFDSANYYHKKALSIRSFYWKCHPDLTTTLLGLSGNYYGKGQYDTALYFTQRALQTYLPDSTDMNNYINPTTYSSVLSNEYRTSFQLKADILTMRYYKSKNISDLKMANSTYQSFLNFQENIRNQRYTEVLNNWSEQYFHPCYGSIVTAYELYKILGDNYYIEQAFIAAERLKTGFLYISLLDLHAKNVLGIPDSIREKEKQLKTKLEITYELIAEEYRKQKQRDNEKIDKYENELLLLKSKYDTLLKNITQRYPEYDSLKYNTKIIDLKKLQSKLNKDEVLIEYVLANFVPYYSNRQGKLFTFIITHNNFEIISQPFDTVFCNNVESLNSFLSEKNISKQTENDYQNYITTAYDLYSKLIKPIENYIKGKSLIIIPDDILSTIPFEALLTDIPENDKIDYRNLPYLIRKYPIDYAYSATLLFNDCFTKKSVGKELLAFAPEYENIRNTDTKKLLAYSEYRDYLNPIPGTKEEVNNIIRLIKGYVYTDFEATEGNFKNIAGNYDILHLAMHTLIDNENPMQSKLVFTMGNNDDEDGMLHTYEIYNMDLTARMVVLSACNTGIGKIQKGEGIISLARGFLCAGVPSIVATLWSVEDRTGADLMTGFYKSLNRGNTKDKALQEAKLNYLKTATQKQSHPHFWAGYVGIGDPAPLFSNKTKTLIIVIVVLVVLIASAVIIFIKRKKLNRKGNTWL